MHALVRPGPRARRRVALAAALAVTAIVGLWTFGSSQASAHWPAPHVEATCATDGGWAVTFSVESWKKSDKGGGGNPHINVAYQVDGGAWQTLPWKGNYSFTTLNNFEFSDYFTVPAGNSSKVRIKVWTTEKWSDGYRNDDPKYSDYAWLPKDCKPKTTTTRDTKPSTTKGTKPTTSTTICEETTTTKTTVPTTVPTTAPTTVPTTEAPTTTKPSTTTTAAPTTTKPTTTAPPTTAPPTTAPPTTMAPPTPVPPAAPTTVTAVQPSTSLPVTGLQTAGMLIMAGGLMAGGFVLIRAARAQV